MKFHDATKNYQDYSSLAGQTTRQAAYAGIALIWLIKPVVYSNSSISFPKPLALGGLLLILCLGVDILGFIISSYKWKSFADFVEHLILEKKENYDTFNLSAPASINNSYNICSAIKYLLLIIAYIFVFYYLYSISFE